MYRTRVVQIHILVMHRPQNVPALKQRRETIRLTVKVESNLPFKARVCLAVAIFAKADVRFKVSAGPPFLKCHIKENVITF